MASTLAPRSRVASPPRRRSALPWTEPELARLILAATGFIGFSVVLIWLILAALVRTPREPNLLEFTIGHPDGVRSDQKPATTEAVVKRIEEFFRDKKDGPVVVILHGAVASRPDGAVRDQSAYFLAPGRSSADPPALIPLTEVMKPFTTRGQRSPTLLVLDCTVEAGDLRMGFFGNGFIEELKRMCGSASAGTDKLAVLAACDESQMSWSMEGQDGSVFAYFVNQFLAASTSSPGPFTTADLHKYVRAGVKHWVDQNRSRAVQAPVLLGTGNLEVRVTQPVGRAPATSVAVATGDSPAEAASTPKPPSAEAASTPKAPSVEAAVFAEWDERDRLSKSKPPPYRYAPVAWRLYQDGLLRAERLLRAGDDTSARLVFIEARNFRDTVRNQRTGPKSIAPWSLGVLRNMAAAQESERSPQADAYAEAIDSLIRAESMPARAADAPGAAGEGVPKASPADATKATPAPPPAVGPRPLAVLTVDGDPTYAEGQLPVWYHEFQRLGGEAPELRADRLHLLERAVAIRAKAEEVVARAARVVPWARPLVEEADRHRRAAQDTLFAGDRESLTKCGDMLDAAQASYDRARDEVGSFARAFDLLSKVQDALPYYGASLVPSDDAGKSLDDIIDQTAKLADLIYQSSPAEPGLDAKKKRLLDAAAMLEASFTRLEGDVQKRVMLAEGEGWREVDALLRVPAIEPTARRRLFERARTLSPAPSALERSSDLDTTDAPDRDKVYSSVALGLANLEHGLLRIAGLADDELGYWVNPANKEVNSKLTAAYFDKISDRARQLREQLATQALAGAAGAGGDAGVRALRQADRIARISPAGHLVTLSPERDPADRVGEIDAEEFMLWNVRRLLDDFDVAAAKRLLARVGRDRPEERDELEKLAAERGDAKLDIKTESRNPGVIRARVSLQPRGTFPADGLALVFFAREPSAAVLVQSRLTSAAHPGSLDFAPRNDGASVVTLTPYAFFRGNFYHEAEFAVPVTQAVKVVIHQPEEIKWGRNKKPLKVADQFKKHQGVGYFHFGKNLPYWLEVINETDERLTAHVARDLAGLKMSDPLVLDPGKSGRIDDEIIGTDQFADKKAKTMVITVTERDEQGRSLCKPLNVKFTPIDPVPYVTARLRLEFDTVRVLIEHSKDDPVPFPVDIEFALMPVASFRQTKVPRASFIPRAGSISTEFDIIADVQQVKSRLSVNGEEVSDKRQVIIVNEKKAAEPVEKGDAEKKADAPAPGDQ